MPSGPSQEPDRRHLHIVCTDPCTQNRQLIVPVTSWVNELCDGTCILDVGDHPWISHRSWIMYRAMKIVECSTIDNGLFQFREPMQDHVSQRIYCGILSSPHTKKKIKKYYELQGVAVEAVPLHVMSSTVNIEEQ